MKKIIYSFLFLSALGTGAYAQQADSRIAAILAKEPAQKATDLNANAEATAALGENGITDLLLQLQPNGSADNTKIYDAVNGFSYYVTQTGRESLRALAVKAYSSALSKLTDKYNQAFIISQLQIIGKDDAVPALKQYLGDERLVDPAARALVKVNTPLSKSTLLQALKGSAGQARLSLVEALGDSEYALAAGPIAGLIGQDKKLDRVSLYALAHIANLKSAGVLAQSSQKVGYTLDESNATSAYVTFISNLAKKGFATNAFALAKSLQANAANAGQVQTQTAALKILVDIRGAKSTPLLLQAIGDKNPQYRAAAMKFAAPYLGPATVQLWLKALAGADKTTKAELIAFFGNNHAYAALPAITRSLNDTDPAIVLAAIKAAHQIGQDKVINNLIGVLKSDNADYATAVQNALLVVKGPAVVNKVAQALPDVPANGKVALINVLAARRAHDKIDIVWALLNNSDNQVKSAAYASLQSLAEENNLPQLFNLLGKSEDPAHTSDVQTAINAVISRLKNPSSQSGLALQQLNNAPASQKTLYFNILAGIGDKASIAAVSKAYDNGDADTKKAAVAALAQWVNGSAVRELLQISKNTNDAALQNKAFRGVVALIGKSDYPADEKVIFLREAFDIAKSNEQRNLVLEELTNDKTYVALLFAGKYLDDPQLQTAAAEAIVSIALSNKEFYGADVRNILNKVIAMRRGGDGDYEREAIKKFIAEMPSGEGFVELFNNKDLSGWKGLVENPIARSKMDAATLAKAQQKADSIMRKGWYVKDSVLNFSGDGDNICTVKQYRNFDMYVDWKIEPQGDAGIYLRGSPQVQIWDTSRVDVGAQVGSGGLYNNQAHENKPLKLADNAIGEWNSFHIIMKDDKVTVYFNGVLVVDNVVLDNYWDRKLPIFPKEQIELQAHGTHVYYRDIYLKELPE